MKNSTFRDKVVEEVNQIPEERLPQLLDFIHHFRIGLQYAGGKTKKGIDFAGAWKEMSENMFQDLMNDLDQRRRAAFSGRQNRETVVG